MIYGLNNYTYLLFRCWWNLCQLFCLGTVSGGGLLRYFICTLLFLNFPSFWKVTSHQITLPGILIRYLHTILFLTSHRKSFVAKGWIDRSFNYCFWKRKYFPSFLQAFYLIQSLLNSSSFFLFQKFFMAHYFGLQFFYCY